MYEFYIHKYNLGVCVFFKGTAATVAVSVNYYKVKGDIYYFLHLLTCQFVPLKYSIRRQVRLFI